MTDETTPARTRDIQIGCGRIIYAHRDGSGLTPGWVLPGGMRTSNEVIARGYAAMIDVITRRHTSDTQGYGR